MTQNPIRAVVAEDDVFVAELLLRDLERAGVQVLARVSDGQAALEATEKWKPDVVILDVQMPRLDGIAAAAAIQEQCPTPVVVLTVHAEPEFATRAARAGVGAYLVKPATPDALLRSIAIARARFQDLQELRRINGELTVALETVRVLKGLLPICGWCKNIRNTDGSWERLETYVQKHSEAEFSHSICPTCEQKHYPEDAKP